MKALTVAILGAGEMASGIAHRLFSSGVVRVAMSEIPEPLAVRRLVSFSEAVHTGAVEVEEVKAELARDLASLPAIWGRNAIAVMVDEGAAFLKAIDPDVLIDATMIKKPKGSVRRLAPKAGLVIGVGPGFTAPEEVDAVIESNRGHDIGRVIYAGQAETYTGTPGTVMGESASRVLRAPHAGIARPIRQIGDMIKKGEVALYVGETPVEAGIDGVVRGMIRPMAVRDREKVGDVDPSGDARHCSTISDKAHAIAGGVLEAVLHRFNV